MNKHTDVDSYLADVPEDRRETLEEVRRLIKAAAPDAVESIAYAMPAYKYRGKPLVYFGAASKHWALYGSGGDAYPEVSERYDTSKGTIKFPWVEPVPADIVEMVVRDRVARIDKEAEEGKGATSKARTRSEG